MAQDKKGFLVYCDIIHSINHLTNEEKGLLFQHILEYVNDMNPVMDNRVILSSWKPIERQLKRDLIKYEETCNKNRGNALKRWNKNNATVCDRIPPNTKHADIDIDIDIDKDININTSEYFLESIAFTEWFNSCRIFIKLKSNIKKLSPMEESLFRELNKLYTIEDFKKSFKSFSKDKYYLDNNLIFPSYFLKQETFIKYLNTESEINKDEEPLWERAERLTREEKARWV